MIRPSLEKIGLALAAGYVFLQPVMLQNPLKPVLSYGLGSMQIADVLFPFMLTWMVWWVITEARSGELRRYALEHRTLGISVVSTAIAFYISGAGTEYSPRLIDVAKYLYLLGLLVFFVLALSSRAVVPVFRVLVYASIAYMCVSLAFYFAAYVYGYSSNFAQIREGFPYLGRVVRLNGPMLPTSKLFGMYLLMLALLLILGRDLVDRWVWRLALALTVVCALLTLGRVGVAAAASVVLGIASFSEKRWRWLALLTIPVLVAAVAIQVLTIWHIDVNQVAWVCSADYHIEEQTQYFGWYREPTMCKLSLDGGITYSSYFLMKLVAWKAWLSHPIFGIGAYQYVEVWRAAVGTDIQEYYRNYLFTMAQSTYLTLLAETGLVGFVAWCSLILVFLRKIMKALSGNDSVRCAFLTWIACFVYALVDLDVQNFRFLYTLLPLAAAIAWQVHRLPSTTR
ncbi:MAG: hypothetical protein DWQ09_13860 [Proteobacteria bacterium]|nr:MAG: hypothetical protein DWQ09_13860 [Pseudomonadota bacterium]